MNSVIISLHCRPNFTQAIISQLRFDLLFQMIDSSQTFKIQFAQTRLKKVTTQALFHQVADLVYDLDLTIKECSP